MDSIEENDWLDKWSTPLTLGSLRSGLSDLITGKFLNTELINEVNHILYTALPPSVEHETFIDIDTKSLNVTLKAGPTAQQVNIGFVVGSV